MGSTLQEKRRNKIIFSSIGVAIFSVILVIILFNIGNLKNKSDNNLQIAQNDNNHYESEQTNLSVGKTVNEVKKNQEDTNDDSLKVQTTNENVSVENEKQEEKIQQEKIQVSENKENFENIEDIQNSTNEINSEFEDEEIAANSKIQEEENNPVFSMPVEGEIVKHYGKDKLVYSNTLKEWTTHLGIDIKADKTTIVKSASDGSVKSIKNDPRYGLTVVIEHNNGFTSVYSNLLTAEFVVEGENVKAGQTLGTVGNTATFEILDDSHLHFEILKDGNAVDPEMYIK